MLDKRLKLCADMVTGKRVCDVGTDHAYLIAELLRSGKCETAVAADINESPLASARYNLEKAGVTDRIDIILSDGLKNVPREGITDIVIAGMGGELIAKILSECDWLVGKNLILQPMSKSDFLLRFLWENGFEIIKRQAVCEGKFCYTVINCVKSSTPLQYAPMPPLFEYIGGFDFTDISAIEYASRQADKLYTSGTSLRDSGHYREALKYMKLAAEIIQKTGGKPMYTVKDIFSAMDVIASMKNLHKGDNSGLIVGDGNAPVSKVLFALDITCEVVREAIEIGAEVIVAHHPVIFHPLYTLDDSNPACLALKHDIACICFHSPLDMADGGINDIIFDMLDPALKLKKQAVLEPIHSDGRGYGWVCAVGNEIMSDKLGMLLKDIFGNKVVRYTNSGRIVKKIAFCSGGAGGNLPFAIEQGADAYVTGDVKHDQWITARNSGIALYDCGHFHTEDIAIPYLIKRFGELLSGLELVQAKSDKDPVDYIM